MATLRRTHPPKHSNPVLGLKRPRSPDHALDAVSKRLKASATAHREKEIDKDKARRHAEREQQRMEFKEKYTRAFPGWKFYVDTDNIHPDNVSSVKLAQVKIRQLGGSIENFFSNNITHLITDQLIPSETTIVPSANKENDIPRTKLKSPIKFKAPVVDESAPLAFDLVSKARGFENTKIWSLPKLMSVLERCLYHAPASASSTAPSTVITSQRSLSRLLQSERLHGTSERDPTQKRHDYKYFNRGTYFMMVEDLRQELATIAVQEYVIPKGRDAANAKAPWPVLHCHPRARGPFIPFDEKEKKRWEKSQRLEADEREAEEKDKVLRVEAMKRKAEARLQACNQGGDLRRSVSMNNMHRCAQLLDELVDLDGDGEFAESAHASRYLPRGYIAASGNSVGITSTTGTTSTAGLSIKASLPPSLRGRQEVLTSRKFSIAQPNGGDMGPPAGVPERQPMLKKSRSTNTMRLPKREEGSKPGYCESCRTKFEDFNKHITGRKHRKFAVDETNFLQLDYILARVKRRTVEEVEQEELDWQRKCSEPRSGDEEAEELLSQDETSSDCQQFDGAFVDLDS
ncbi:Dfp1/Him1, central region-domain-containing protein [Mycena pura]|uniref:Dfp1/Him1, central region-domain-containing protein n=1 Tax=Mycena pura TaxID=153505 RepID=A0AAD6VD03_9AGAR|nr:Dfp1/Him1, central region-domain-containing protein [Mycena pura]